jgi:hypothetical protein
VEPLFGEAKDWQGLGRFRLRRLEKVNIEALLIASGQNIKRLVAARGRSPRRPAQVAALRPPDPVSRCRPHLSDRRAFRLPNRSVFQQAGKLSKLSKPRIRSQRLGLKRHSLIQEKESTFWHMVSERKQEEER